jgi:hypothetical protein
MQNMMDDHTPKLILTRAAVTKAGIDGMLPPAGVLLIQTGLNICDEFGHRLKDDSCDSGWFSILAFKEFFGVLLGLKIIK